MKEVSKMILNDILADRLCHDLGYRTELIVYGEDIDNELANIRFRYLPHKKPKIVIQRYNQNKKKYQALVNIPNYIVNVLDNENTIKALANAFIAEYESRFCRIKQYESIVDNVVIGGLR